MHYSNNINYFAGTVHIGARDSRLSKVQLEEVFNALKHYHPHIQVERYYMDTIGDRDQKKSLRTLERTDFFTRDIDQWVLQGNGRVGVHSAKDLPQELCSGLALFCLTAGIDSSDVLVMQPGLTLQTLPQGACIATSSQRREENVRQMRSDLQFCDIRGTIEQRLAHLTQTEIAGVVIAKAALIRLGLTNCNHITIPGPTASGQGQLAVVGRKDESTLQALFQCLDVS